MDELSHIECDPYKALQVRHKLPYSYTLEFVGDLSFLVRNECTEWQLSQDPGYVDLQDDDWRGEEYGLEDELPPLAIVDKQNLLQAYKNHKINKRLVNTCVRKRELSSTSTRKAKFPKRSNCH
tara:strand:+ start:1716 stop:2084 length:369 start_codon:yes stop_codon:yes gene_type:complete